MKIVRDAAAGTVMDEETNLPVRTVTTQDQMRLIEFAVEYGFRQHEKGEDLQAALAGMRNMYIVLP